MTFQVFGQTFSKMDIKISEIDTTQPIFNFYTFERSLRSNDSVIVIKQLWVEKTDFKKVKKLRINKVYTIVVDKTGPNKIVVDNDTLEIRGHLRLYGTEWWLERKSNEEYQTMIQYFEPLEIKETVKPN